jgi:signal recognition particle subunit SRP54|tara:strand:+ start:3004 stop:4356 length:1353 start_codon:yes stop_codon:yes gene_type:complete
MLENLTDRLQLVVKTIRGQARFTEENISDAMREVRIALIEADVALPVIKYFIERVKDKALGAEVLKSLNPGQAVIKIVQDELTDLMGSANTPLNLSTTPPAIILMAGLQGSGKTTTSAKLAKIISEQKKKVLLVSADVYRPAAIEQLKTLAASLNIECFNSSEKDKPNNIAIESMAYAKKHYIDVIIFDTAGRLGVDDAMMKEIKQLHKTLGPAETLFVVDSMQGQDAVNTAKSFGDTLPLTGIVLTKLDGDSRGGAALSVRHITGQPIKYIGVSEKTNGLELFHPERMASRILGMGDIVSLVEDAQKNIDVKEAEKLAEKVKSGKNFDLNDFRNQIAQMQKMGGVGAMMKKMPSQIADAAYKLNAEDGDKSMVQIEAIISSMTPLERSKPDLLKAKRKIRIASGSGTHVQDINRLLKQFEEMQKMMKMFTKGGMGKLMRGLSSRFPGMG